ncbi:MAG: TIGR02099 family protein [Methylococcaceae bacterium]|nr:TIGR02099 family protein [Methylococcaceae bacterium]
MKFHVHLSRFAAWLSLALLVALALASLTVRYVLVPLAADYREDLERLAGEALGQPVGIGELTAGVSGFHPQIVLKHVVVGGAEGEPLRFGRLSLALDPWRSLLARSPVLAGIGLAQGEITLQKQADGGWSVVGLPTSEGRPDWLMAVGRLHLEALDLRLDDARAPGAFRLGRLTLDLRNDGVSHVVDFALAPAPELGRQLQVVAEIGGDLAGDDWHGRVYLDGRGVRTGRLTDLFGLPMRQQAGMADFKLWTEWDGAALRQAVAWLEWGQAGLSYRWPEGIRQLAFDSVSGWLRWQRQGDGWRLRGQDWRFGLFQPARQPVDFAVSYGPSGNQWALASTLLNLEDVRAVLDALGPVDSEVRERLQSMSPRGELHGLSWFRDDVRWALAAELRDVGFKPWRQTPGLTGLNAVVRADDAGGSMRFRMDEGAVEVPAVFPEPIVASRFSGELGWGRSAEGWRLQASDLVLESRGLRFDGHFGLDGLDRADGSPLLDLRVRLGGGDLPARKHFLPYGVIPVTSAWLADALTAGHVDGVDMVLNGPLHAYPFRSGEGVFEVAVDCRDVDLRYQPDWPALKGVDAKLLFTGPTLSIDANRGTIGEGRIRWAKAEVADLERAPRLRVTGEVDASVNQAMDFLAASPLASIPGRLRKFADLGGDSRIALKLDLPLRDGLGEPKVDGIASLKDASLRFPQLGQTLGGIGGDLHFSVDDLEGNGLRAQFLGSPVELDLAGDRSDIAVNAVGRVRMSALQTMFPGGAWEYLDGEASYRLQLAIPKALDAADAPLRAQLESDLSGLTVHLPEPFAKSGRSRVPLRAELQLQGGKPTPLKLRYREFFADLLLAPPAEGFGLRQGRLGWGGEPPPVVDGLSLALRLPVLDGSAWYELWRKHGAGTGSGPPLVAANVDLAELYWQGRDLGPVSLRATRSAEGWQGEGDTAFGTGNFRYQHPSGQPGVLRLELDQLRLPKSETQESGSEIDWDPASLPAIEVSSRKTAWHGIELGSLKLTTRPLPLGLEIASLGLHKEHHSLKLNGTWLRQAGADETRVKGRLATDDLGELLADFGYAREIRGSPTKLAFELDWPGSPDRFGLASLRGDVRMALGRGSVLNVDPGLGRALGMLNLGTLRRLLLLDFRDLFGKGMAYDGMKGVFHLAGGQANTEAFLIDAAAARIFVTGRVGLVAKDLDETVVVMPHTLASIPVAGALMGGAAVGMAYNFAQSLMGEKTVSIASTTYQVRGGWDNPAIERIEGNMPLELINRTWSDFKSLSGLEADSEENQP